MTRKLRWMPVCLMLGLLAGCRSQQVAFRFSPPHRVAQPDSSTVAVVPTAPAALPVAASAPDAAPAPRYKEAAWRAKRPAVPLAALGRAGVQAASRLLAPPKRVRAAAAPAAIVAEERSSWERNALFIGIITVVLGVGLIIGVGSRTFAAATLLLDVASVLLWIGGLALALWFVLLVLRASKEG